MPSTRSIAQVLTAIACLTLPGTPASAQDSSRDSSTRHGRPNADTVYQREDSWSYLRGTFGVRPAVRAIALAGFDQWRGRPRAFPGNGRGFADRLGSRYAQVAISHTLRFGVARAFEVRTIRYQPCNCGQASARIGYALLAPLRVTTPNGIRLSAFNPVTELLSGILVTPAHSGGLRIGEGVRNGLTGIATESAASLLREFWPFRWRPPFL